jgi:excisionase family DNA binding protein
MSTPLSPLLTYTEAAKVLSVSVITVKRLVKSRKLRCIRPCGPTARQNNPVRFRQCDLEAYLSKTASVPYC